MIRFPVYFWTLLILSGYCNYKGNTLEGTILLCATAIVGCLQEIHKAIKNGTNPN